MTKHPTLIPFSFSALRTLAVLALPMLAFSPARAEDLQWSAVGEPGVGGAVTSIQVCPLDSEKIVVGGDMLGATWSEDGGETWHDSFGLTNWECADSTWKPGSTTEVWLATMGGPFKSVDGGKNWVSKRAGMPAPETYWGYNVPIQKILFDPNDSSRMLAFGGSRRGWVNMSYQTAAYGAVWESLDAGETWVRKGTIADNGTGVGGAVNKALFSPGSSTVLYAVLKEEGVFKSTDGGSTWKVKNSGLPGAYSDFIAIHPENPDILWWSGRGKRAVFKSTDGAENWKFSGEGLTSDSVHDHIYYQISVVPSTPDVLYVANGNWQQIFKSTDGGANWVDISENRPETPTGLSFQGTWFANDHINPKTVYTCNSVTIFKSTDAGSTWIDVSSKPGAGPGLWQGRGYSGYVAIRAKWNPFNPDQVVLQAMDDGKFMQSTDNLTNWRMHGPTMDQWHGGNDVTFGGPDGRTIYVSLGQDPNGEPPAKSTDGGLTWTYLTNVGSGYSASIHTLPDDTSQVWFIRGGRLYHSTDSGTTWEEIDVDKNTELCQIVGEGDSDIYLAAKNGVYKGDSSNVFEKIASVENSESMRIALDPSKKGRFYMASHRYNQWHAGIYRYDEGKLTRINTNEYAADVAVDPQNPNRVVMVTNHNPGVEISQATGVWVTENALDENPVWKQQNAGLPMLRGMTLAFHPTDGTIIVGLNGRGFYKAGGSAESAKKRKD